MKKSLNFKASLRVFSVLLLTFIFAISTYAEVKTVTGVVKDKDGLTLIGAAITVKNSPGVGTVTDIDGRYSLKISSNDVLVYRYLGYQTKEEKVGNRSVINVTMGEDSKMLEDVVVVGYGSQKKESVVGSITQAKGEDLLQAGSVSTVSEALTGLLPGVSTMQGQGQPGSTAASILIRGKASWSDSNPLTLVDGVERDFNDLDPNEIESISVLKDASATAVFGIKAANGVILITTKTGKKGKPRVSFSANVGMKEPTIQTNFQTPYYENLEYQNMANMNDFNYSALVPEFYINYWKNPEQTKEELNLTDDQYNDFYSYTCYVDDLYKTGYTQQYNLNISGGNDFVSYFTSFGYNYDGDILDVEEQRDFDPRTYQDKFSWRSNLDFNFTKTTKFSVKLSGDMTNWNGNPITKANTDSWNSVGLDFGRMYQTAQINSPTILSNGKLGIDANNSINVNYFGKMEREGSYSTKKNRLYTDFILEQKIFKDITAKAKLSYNYTRKYTSHIAKQWGYEPIYYYVPSDDGYTPNRNEDGSLVYSVAPDQIDQFERPAKLEDEKISAYSKDLYYEGSLNYNHSFGKHDVGLLGLFSRRNYQSGANFPNYEEAWVGRVTYGYANKYLFEANGAYNGSERFAPGDRFGFFPSMALGWVLSEENFMKENLSFIDFFKIRYSYGEVGSDSGARRFAYLTSYSSGSSSSDYRKSAIAFGDIPTIGTLGNDVLDYYVEGEPISNVTWETAIKQNLGFEINTIKNKLRMTLDLFNERREDILMQRQVIPIWYGNSNPYANVGETKNHGVEVELKWNDRIGKDWSYWLKGNISLSENRIVNRDDPEPTPEYRKEAGKPIGWISGLQDYGYYQNWDDIYKYPTTSLNTNILPGDLRFNDYNADGIVDTNDYVAIGEPSYATRTYTFSFGVNYKNWSLTSMFNGVFGISKSVSTNYLNAYDTASSSNWMMLNNEAKDCWTPDNTNADYHVLHATDVSAYSEQSTFTIRNSSYLRLRNLEVKYTFPKDLLSRTNFFKTAEVYVNGNNLYTWQTLPKAFDAEQKSLDVYPISKRYNLGVRFSF